MFAGFLLYNIVLLGQSFLPAKEAGIDPYDRYVQAISKAMNEAHAQNFLLLSDTLWSSTAAAMKGPLHSLNAFDDGYWPLPWLIRHSDDPQAAWIWENAMLNPFLKALDVRPSPVILVDESPGQARNILALLKADKRTETGLSHYAPIAHGDFCSDTVTILCRYSLLKRRD